MFILHDSVGHNFDRLKMQYYLLPHNVYNYGSLPPGELVKEGDYVLVLGAIAGLEYSSEESALKWGSHGRLPATLKHAHARGNLYLVGAKGTVLPAVPQRMMSQ